MRVLLLAILWFGVSLISTSAADEKVDSPPIINVAKVKLISGVDIPLIGMGEYWCFQH